MGYNKLDYTQACIENLLKYIPKDLNYELILINHGSNDGTKEFFESVVPDKQIDILRNGGGFEAFTRVIEGKYVLFVSNDILVTENAIENLLACVKSDPSIAYVVPATSNISNYQTIKEDFKSPEEMFLFAAKNNRLNPLKWEQRTRLINPIAMFPANLHLSSTGILSHTYKLSEDGFLFPDDMLSYFIRKRSKKMILAKDAYCFHYGSVTLKDSELDREYYFAGQKSFYNYFGFNPWGKGFCYDLDLLKVLDLQQKNDANILGISPGIGSNPLKFKTMLRELGSKNTKLFIASEEERFKIDYETYTEPDLIRITPESEFLHVFPKESFDYIIVEKDVEFDEVQAYIARLREDGKLILWCNDPKAVNKLHSVMPKTIVDSSVYKSGVWCVLSSNSATSDSPDGSRIEVSVLSQSDLKATNFDVDPSNVNFKKIRFLLRRLEFGVEPEKTKAALADALSDGSISKEDLNRIIASSWVDNSRLNELANSIL